MNFKIYSIQGSSYLLSVSGFSRKKVRILFRTDSHSQRGIEATIVPQTLGVTLDDIMK